MILWSDTTGLYSTTCIQTSLTANSAVVDTLSLSSFRTVKYIIQATQGTSFQVVELLAIHDGAVVNAMEYGNISTGTTKVFTTSFSVASSSSQLTLTRLNTSSTVDIIIHRQIIRFPVTTSTSTIL